jgi:hypothetical protein
MDYNITMGNASRHPFVTITVASELGKQNFSIPVYEYFQMMEKLKVIHIPQHVTGNNSNLVSQNSQSAAQH